MRIAVIRNEKGEVVAIACARCHRTGRKLLRHHVSYDPEILELICYACHQHIKEQGIHPLRQK